MSNVTEDWYHRIMTSGGSATSAPAQTIVIAGVDDTATEGSPKLITSGAVYRAMESVAGTRMSGGYVNTTNEPIYIFRLDPTEDDPATCISYPSYAVNANYTPATVSGYGTDWGGTVFGNIKPCVVQNGVVNYWLDPTNIFKKADGVTDAVLTGADGDVCSAIPTLYWRTSAVVKQWISTSVAQYEMEVAISHGQFDGSHAYAHTLDTLTKPYLFVGCFEGLVVADALRSVYSSTETPTVNKTNDEFQLLATTGGTGYSIETYNTWTLLGLIEMMIYKTTNMQAVLGQGRTQSNNTAAVGIGDSYRHNAGGPNYGLSADGTVAMRSLYVENRYGNVWKFLTGIYKDSSDTIWLNTKNTRFITQNTASPEIPAADHVAVSGVATATEWIKKFRGSDPTPLLPSEVGGSSSTYAPDYYYYSSGARTCVVGGGWSNGASCGPFYVCLCYAPSSAGSRIGAHLQILGAAA